MKEKCELLQIGDVATLSGTTIRTVRYYLEQGFIQYSERTPGGFYLFDRNTPEQVRFVYELKELGISLKEIKALFNIRRDSSTGNEAYPLVREKLIAHRDQVARSVQTYTKLLNELDAAVKVVSQCDGCNQKPNRENCTACEIISSKKNVPVPVMAIL